MCSYLHSEVGGLFGSASDLCIGGCQALLYVFTEGTDTHVYVTRHKLQHCGKNTQTYTIDLCATSKSPVYVHVYVRVYTIHMYVIHVTCVYMSVSCVQCVVCLCVIVCVNILVCSVYCVIC